MKTPNPIIQNSLVLLLLISFSSLAPAQDQYGDLELTVKGNGTESAIGIPVKAVDQDLGTTSLKTTDENSQAYFEDLYIYTIDGVDEQYKKKIPSLEGMVKTYNLSGQVINEKLANKGMLLWKGADNTANAGIYLAQDEKGNSVKFLYLGSPTLIGKNIPQKLKSALIEETNLYELHADGRNLEFNPFDEFMEVHELEANILNEVELNPSIVSDGPSTGQVEILVNGEPAGDNSQVKIVETGTFDTTYLTTTSGIALFDANDGVTSHPFGNYTRAYSILINAFNADSNWFHAETNNVDMALGAGNDFLFNPAPITDAERTADVTLEIILTNGNPASADAETKTYRLGSTDTTFAFTNSSGVAEYSLLVHPFQPDAHEIAINSNACASNQFDPLTEAHDLGVGQNNIEMNPNPVAENFAEGPARTWYGSGLIQGTEVSIWRLNNTMDTVMYVTNAAGMIYYENLPLEGSSSDYVFQSFKESTNGNPILTSLDTFNLVTGVNLEKTINLEEITQFIVNTGTLRYAFDQSTFVSGANVEIREVNNGPTIGSAVTDANGFYSISGIPSGAEAEFFVNGIADHFNKVNAYTFDEVFNYSDTLVENQNMMVYELAWPIPQTDNDPAPATVNVDPALIEELIGPDEKNAEETLRNVIQLHLPSASTSDSAYLLAVIAAGDSLFHGGTGSPFVLVPNPINITLYHQLNYDPLVGFPGELGYNVTFGGGNTTTTIRSNTAEHYILGGYIEITGGLNNLESGIKELEGRVKQMGAMSIPGMMYPSTTTYPNNSERAYDNMSNINITARIDTGYEIFHLNGLTTTIRCHSESATESF